MRCAQFIALLFLDSGAITLLPRFGIFAVDNRYPDTVSLSSVPNMILGGGGLKTTHTFDQICTLYHIYSGKYSHVSALDGEMIHLTNLNMFAMNIDSLGFNAQGNTHESPANQWMQSPFCKQPSMLDRHTMDQRCSSTIRWDRDDEEEDEV